MQAGRQRNSVSSLAALSLRATLANVNRIPDFTLMPEHLVMDLFTVRHSSCIIRHTRARLDSCSARACAAICARTHQQSQKMHDARLPRAMADAPVHLCSAAVAVDTFSRCSLSVGVHTLLTGVCVVQGVMAQGKLTPALVKRFQHSGHERVLAVIKVRDCFCVCSSSVLSLTRAGRDTSPP